MTRLDRVLVILCARCGGWLSVSDTYEQRPYDVLDGADGAPELIVLRLPRERDVDHYIGDRGCGCGRLPGQRSPQPRPEHAAEEMEWYERQRAERIARGEAVIFP